MTRGSNSRIALWLVVVAMCLTTRVAAQARPDFSGNWVLESEPPLATASARAISVSMSLVQTNVRGEPMTPYFKDISVVREFADSTSSDTYLIGFVGGVVGGRTTASSDRLNSHYRVEWEDQALVIENGTYIGTTRESGQWAERREVWSLDAGGRLRVMIATRNSVGTSSEIALLYRRK